MKLFRLIILCVIFSTAIYAATPLTEPHPGYTISTIRPNSFTKSVSGIDFLSDGSLIISTFDGSPGFGKDGNPTEVFRVSNHDAADRANIVIEKFHDQQFIDAMGVVVVNDNVFVSSKHAIHRLTDTNGDGRADQIEKIAEGWTGKTDNFHHYNFGPLYKDGKFYITTGTGWGPYDEGDNRGTYIEIDSSTGNFNLLAGGLRSPSGMLFSPDSSAIFATDNEGHWLSTNRLNQLESGKFYGFKHSQWGDPSVNENQPQENPVLWFPYSDISLSPTGLVQIPSGIYKDHYLIGDIYYGGIQRLYLEKVKGQYQGTIFRHSGGLESASFRMIAGDDGSIYIAGLGGPGGNWRWENKMFGLQKLTPTNTVPFEMLAIRSTSSTTFDIEFTKPAGNSASQANNYQVRSWYYVPGSGYGQGKKQGQKDLNVTNVDISGDKKTVTLTFSGLNIETLGTLVYFKLNNITSETGETIYQDETWYTLNNYGPADPTPVLSSASKENKLRVFTQGNSILVNNLPKTSSSIALLNLKGETVYSSKLNWQSSISIPLGHNLSGIYMLKVSHRKGIENKTLYLK